MTHRILPAAALTAVLAFSLSTAVPTYAQAPSETAPVDAQPATPAAGADPATDQSTVAPAPVTITPGGGTIADPPSAPSAPDSTPAPAPLPAPPPTNLPAPPAVPLPAIPAPAAPVPNMTDPTALNLAARDPQTLHPVLIPTDLDLRNAMQAGRGYGKGRHRFTDLIGAVQRPFAIRRDGPLRLRATATGVAYWITPGFEARWRGFLQQRRFSGSAVREADFEAVRTRMTSASPTLTFLVEMNDLVPQRKKKSDPPPVADPEAARARVEATRFILSDDQDNNYEPLTVTATPVIMPRAVFYPAMALDPARVLSGHIELQEPETVTPPATLGLGDAPPVDAPPQLSAFWLVTFSAYNPDGTARINRDTKFVTLRVISASDVKNALFEVAKMP